GERERGVSKKSRNASLHILFFFFFCFNHSIIVLRYKLACSASYGGKTYKANKPISSSDQGSKPETPRPSGMGPTARQLHKSKEIHREEVTRKPLPTSRLRKDSSH